MLTEQYVCGPLEAAARGLNAPTRDLAVLEAHPLPVHLGAVVHAYVNHGRWLADCPICNGAENVTSEYPFFFCDSCGMSWTQRQLARVVFPPDMLAASSVLGRRREARVRNWRPGENPDGISVADWLHAENIVHGASDATPAERVRAKALYIGVGSTGGDLARLDELGDSEFNRLVLEER